MSDSLIDTITPKSDQLNADDLMTGAATYTITKVTRGSQEQPINVFLAEHPQPWKPCKSMRRVLIAIWGDQGTEWVGKRLTLYNDPAVKYAGVAVGGIRVSHMSGIEIPTELMLTKSKGKRTPVTIQPIPGQPYPPEDFDKNFPAWQKAIGEGKHTSDSIIAGVQSKGTLTLEQVQKIQGIGNG